MTDSGKRQQGHPHRRLFDLPDDPYGIATAEDLGAINHHDLAACYRLEADIDLVGIAWNKAPIQYFGGQFGGAGKIVTGLKIQGDIRLGLFGDLGRDASVVNLGIRDAASQEGTSWACWPV